MPNGSLMQGPDGERVWTDNPAAYAGWAVVEESYRMPGPGDRRENGRWVKDTEALAAAAEEARLMGMTRAQMLAEATERAVGRLRAELVKGGSANG